MATKYKIFFSLIFCLWLMACGLKSTFAGNLDSSAAPSSDTTRMYTLEQIYDKLHDATSPIRPTPGSSISAVAA